MPSIPQSLLWISLVVLWLFVLVPMLINKRDTVKRTSDVALATRVLNTAGSSRLLRRSGPAAGHRHDPQWRAEPDLDDDFSDYEAEDYDDAVRAAVREAEVSRSTATQSTAMVVASMSEATTEPVYIDVDIVDENSGALPAAGVQESLFDQAGQPVESVEEAPTVTEREPEPLAEDAAPAAGAADAAVDEVDEDTYEYVDDSSGLEASDAEDAEDARFAAPRPSNRRRRMESNTAAAVTARKYRFRKRMLTAMAAAMVVSAVLAFTASDGFWWACGGAATVTILYLGYLRRQTRIEEQVRRRRQQRLARTRIGEESADERVRWDAPVDVVPSRLRRPGAVVLDIDDEDPTFDHLDEVRYSRRYDLPRAAGQ